MKARLLILVLLCIFSFCCRLKLSVEERAYLKRVMKTPIVFTVPNEKAEEIWGRIHSFIGRYSSMEIWIATDYVIQTYEPRGFFDYGYIVVRTPKEDDFEFSIECMGISVLKTLTTKTITNKNDKVCNRNAHLLAYFALSGEEVPWLIRKTNTRRK